MGKKIRTVNIIFEKKKLDLKKQNRDGKTFDWFKDYSELSSILKNYISINDKILMVGCGNSTLSEDMYKDGFKNIINIDFSATVIENMKQRCKHLSEMECKINKLFKDNK